MFVAVHFHDPVAATGVDAGISPLALARPFPLDQARGEAERDRLRAVGATIQHHHDFIREAKPPNTAAPTRWG